MQIEHPKAADIPALRALWKEAFGDTDAFLDTFFSVGFDASQAMVVKKETVLAAVYWFDSQWEGRRIAYLYAVATKKECRGQGLCTALLKTVHTRLAEDYAGAVLVPADEALRHFYEKLGFRSFGGMEEMTIFAEEPSVFCEKLTVDAYMTHREMLLSQGSIMPCGRTLDFLRTQAEFYGGDGWLLCGREENGDFDGKEYLGSKALLPQIFCALQVKSGRVLVSGKTPYAMYREFSTDTAMPSYFAFALD